MVPRENSGWKRVTRRRFLGAVGTGAAAVAMAAACGGGGKSKSAPEGSAAPGSSQAGASTKQLGSAAKVGGFIDRTGATANVGTVIGEATRDWVDYANNTNLVGRKI